jgi:hypothetical protein
MGSIEMLCSLVFIRPLDFTRGDGKAVDIFLALRPVSL